MGFIETIILGIAQGISEWLPISSEGVAFLLAVNFFETITAAEIVRLSLFFHMGTFLAALIYFRKEVWELLKKLFNYKNEEVEDKRLIRFYLIASGVSGLVAYMILRFIETLENVIEPQTDTLLIVLGGLLIVTGLLQFSKKIDSGKKKGGDATLVDGVITGLAQGFAVIPGLSRSGLTVSALLLKGFDDNESLRLSFILSLPIVLLGNIVLDTKNFILTPEFFVGLLVAFGLGLATIHLLLKLASRMKFGYFVILFGLLVIGSTFI